MFICSNQDRMKITFAHNRRYHGTYFFLLSSFLSFLLEARFTFADCRRSAFVFTRGVEQILKASTRRAHDQEKNIPLSCEAAAAPAPTDWSWIFVSFRTRLDSWIIQRGILFFSLASRLRNKRDLRYYLHLWALMTRKRMLSRMLLRSI